MRSIVIILVIIILLVAAGVIYMYSGYYNIAATQPHWKTTVSIINRLRNASIAAHSTGIQPTSITDPKLLNEGLRHFHEMCRLCHGAPGYEKEEFAKGLYPKPPDLASRGIQQLRDAEIFWVLKNGIKMTGMPAFGPTHQDDELWGMVSISRRLPGLTPEQYKKMLKTSGVGSEKEHHH